MQNVGLVLLAFAFVFAVIAAFFLQAHNRVHFGWAALAFWIGAELLGGLGRAFH